MNIIYHGKELSGGGGAGIPTGLISIWYGAVDSIPDGWALCDGTNGTPDLRDRFVLGAGGKYGVGAKGGEETHRLTTAEMPSHKHAMLTFFKSTTGTTTSVNAPTGETNKNPVYTQSAGSGAAHNNMPPYYALCYIMKL